METSIIKIGNSKGLIVPQGLLKQANIDKQVILELTDDGLILKAKEKKARNDWSHKFSKETGSKEPVVFFSNKFDKTEWEW